MGVFKATLQSPKDGVQSHLLLGGSPASLPDAGGWDGGNLSRLVLTALGVSAGSALAHRLGLFSRLSKTPK